jgi:Cft2 family RNA processing exonuclease
MKITNLNPAEEIGASSWLVEIDNCKLLIDAGLHPKREGQSSLPLLNKLKENLNKEDLDAIVISHCHHDHVGALPIVVNEHPKANVLMTGLSYIIVERVLHSSVNVMTRQYYERKTNEPPLYSHDEIDEITPRFQGFRYNRFIEWAAFPKTRSGLLSPTLEFFDSGHALGAAGILVSGKSERFFYTGDVCFHNQTILKAARFEEVSCDVLLIETTRGNRHLQRPYNREIEIDKLAKAIKSAQKRKGSILIPVFALGRTQEILAVLANMIESGQIKRQPIYISGLSKVFTEIYDIEAPRTNRNLHNLRLTEYLDLIVLEKNQIDELDLRGGKLLVLTSGMMNEHTASHDIAPRFFQDERHSIFFVGYADPDTPAGRLRASKQGESFFFSDSTGEFKRLCEVSEYDLTAHANKEDMIKFIENVSPSVVVLGHGSKESIEWFKNEITNKFPRIKVLAPAPSETIAI